MPAAENIMCAMQHVLLARQLNQPAQHLPLKGLTQQQQSQVLSQYNHDQQQATSPMQSMVCTFATVAHVGAVAWSICVSCSPVFAQIPQWMAKRHWPCSAHTDCFTMCMTPGLLPYAFTVMQLMHSACSVQLLRTYDMLLRVVGVCAEEGRASCSGRPSYSGGPLADICACHLPAGEGPPLFLLSHATCVFIVVLCASSPCPFAIYYEPNT